MEVSITKYTCSIGAQKVKLSPNYCKTISGIVALTERHLTLGIYDLINSSLFQRHADLRIRMKHMKHVRVHKLGDILNKWLRAVEFKSLTLILRKVNEYTQIEHWLGDTLNSIVFGRIITLNPIISCRTLPWNDIGHFYLKFIRGTPFVLFRCPLDMR